MPRYLSMVQIDEKTATEWALKALEKTIGFEDGRIATAVANMIERLGKLLGTAMCFVAGTKVHTADGLKNIEEVRAGDFLVDRSGALGLASDAPVYLPFERVHAMMGDRITLDIPSSQIDQQGTVPSELRLPAATLSSSSAHNARMRARTVGRLGDDRAGTHSVLSAEIDGCAHQAWQQRAR